MSEFRAAAMVLGILVFYLFIFERFLIRVKCYRIAVPNLPAAFSGFRIVHLSDLHYGFLQPLFTIRYVIWRANRIKRDIIVCTGDYVLEKGGHKKMDRVWPVIGELHAPEGVYSVLGNHDHWADTERSLEWLDKTGQNIRGRTVVFERNGESMLLSGGGDFWEDAFSLDDLFPANPRAGCRIVLAHNPDSADTPRETRIDLMISGHTHGGQFVLPFYGPVSNPVVNKTYTSGLKRSKTGLRVFISRGIGWGTFPVRLNCFPEIAVLELYPLTSGTDS